MAPFNQVGSTQNNGPLIMQANQTNASFGVFIVPWIFTARSIDSTAVVWDDDARTAETCYIRGLKERVRIYTSTSLPWEWRRIIFTLKGDFIYNGPNATATTPLYIETSSGYQRFCLATTAAGSSVNQVNVAANLCDQIFRGALGTDYPDPLTAPTDATRTKILYDKTIVIKSSNNSGTQITKQFWHPINKNLVYNDAEVGETKLPFALSTTSRPGVGDCYVVDIFKPHPSATTDVLSFGPEATLYWHEK